MGSRAWKQKCVNLHHMLRSRNAQFIRLVGRAHLLYLGLLPSLATFALLRTYGCPARFMLFIAGVAAVGIYLLHRQSKEVRRQTIVGLAIIALISSACASLSCIICRRVITSCNP